MTSLYPLKLQSPVKTPIWGGTRLIRDWGKAPKCETVGESWELTVRPNDESTVCNGALIDVPLGEVIARFGAAVMGEAYAPDGGFPLLVKLIDAADRLSVQVHPDDSYAARVENDRGKTEMWYIVEADAGAEIICGLCEGVTKKELSAAVAEGRIEEVLQHVPVTAGECYFIPAGLPHAIGKGILIAEIQQNCDLTYRVYDYERRDKNGNPRELHVEKALDVIRSFSVEEIDRIRFAKADERDEALLAACDYFRTEKLTPAKNAPISLSHDGRMRHLLCIDGAGELLCKGEGERIVRGDSYLLPAALQDMTLYGEGVFLLTSV